MIKQSPRNDGSIMAVDDQPLLSNILTTLSQTELGAPYRGALHQLRPMLEAPGDYRPGDDASEIRQGVQQSLRVRLSPMNTGEWRQPSGARLKNGAEAQLC